MRKFVSEVRRCDELERKLRFIEEEVKKDDVPIPEPDESPKAPNPREIIDLEVSDEKITQVDEETPRLTLFCRRGLASYSYRRVASLLRG